MTSQTLTAARKSWLGWVPGLEILRQYQAAWLRNDIVAGIVLSTMLVPVGIAYAVASGVPAIYGLYATIVPLLVYALFGPSRILVLGPDSSLAPVILGVVLPLSVGDPMRAVALASAMAIVSGAVCILAGVFRLGFITELLSKPIRYGYMNGIALGRPDQPVAQVVRHQDREHGPAARPVVDRQSAAGRRGQLDRRRARHRDAGRHPAVQAAQAHPHHPDRGRRRDGARRPAASFGGCGGESAGPRSAGPARLLDPLADLERHRPGPARRLCRRDRLVRGHERAVAHLRGADRHARRPEPGDGRPRRSQSSPPDSSRDSRSAAARRARPSPKPRAPARS